MVPIAHWTETSSSGVKHRFYRHHPMLHSEAYLLDMGDDRAATPGQASQAHLLGTAPGGTSGGFGRHFLWPPLDHLVDQTELPGRLGSEKVVTLERVLDLLQ